MQFLICVLIAFLQISRCQSTVDSFEFGTNKGRVAFTTSGKIGLFEKVIRVPVVVPQCEVVSYVRVDVDNTLGPPKVHIEADLNTVVIEYRILQYSISSYTITAKSVTDPYC